MSINSAVIGGNLTRDPELRSTRSGMAVMTISIAVNERRKNSQTGEWDDYPSYIDCTMFGERAQKVAKMISKGSKVTVQGKLRQERWEKDGQPRSKMVVIADDIDLPPKPKGSDGYGAHPGGGYDDGMYGDDIPF